MNRRSPAVVARRLFRKHAQAVVAKVARPTLDPRFPLVFVTSWNEWNEDTAIQPVGGTLRLGMIHQPEWNTRRAISTAGKGPLTSL